MTEKLVFLDTSFLIASQVSKHEFFERTKYLRRNFLLKQYKICTSSIVFDEFWYVLLGILKTQLGNDRNTIYNLIQKATENVLSMDGLNLINIDLNQKGLLSVLKIMYRFKLRPRDAIIIKLMKNAKIKHIASFDKDFDKISGILRIY